MVGPETIDTVSADGHVVLGQLFVHFVDLDFVFRDREMTAEKLDEMQAKLVGLLDCAIHAEAP